MLKEDEPLIRWARQGSRSDVTLGQLTALLELLGSTSVAALGGSNLSRAVNYRQKLDRLERALGLGGLTKRVGQTTQVSELGQRVAGEMRLILKELQTLERSSSPYHVWQIGAGDTWLQSAVTPALARAATGDDSIRWEIRNLRSRDIFRALREGRLHFGLVRANDINPNDGFIILRCYPGVAFCVFAGDAHSAPPTLPGLLQWLRRQQRPFVQQGTSWQPLRRKDGLTKDLTDLLQKLEPTVTCETHSQAAASAAQGASWCIVPTGIAHLFRNAKTRAAPLFRPNAQEEMALVTYPRYTDKLPKIGPITQKLKTALGSAIAAG